jgi:hypothetical protein
MKPSKRLPSLLLLSQLVACTRLMTPLEHNEQMAYWLDQHEFAKASALLATPSSEHDQLQKTLNTKISQYEQKIISDAELAVTDNHWATAFDLYQQALKHLPNSLVLQQASRALRNRHSEQLAKLDQDRLIAKGEWLLKDLAISQLADTSITDSWFSANPLADKYGEATELATQLTQLGKHALGQKDLALAARALPLAWQLSPADNTKALQEELQAMLKSQEPRPAASKPLNPATTAPSSTLPKVMEPSPSTESSQAGKTATTGLAEAAQEQKKTKHMLAEFKNALKKMDFAEARQLMGKLAKQGVDSAAFAKLSKQLDDQVAEQVTHLTETGVNYYSHQQYGEAMKAWKTAQTLDPNNQQLIAHIERVTKVLEKLQDLRNKRRS